MSGPDQRHTHWRRWLAVLAVGLVTGAAVAGVRLAGGSDRTDPLAGLDLADQLAARVVVTLEQATLAEHAEHGHHFDEDAREILCAARTFGFDPPDATAVAQVRVVYVHHMCAEVGPGRPWPQAVRAAGPLAVELTTDPVTVLLPERALLGVEDASYADRIREIIPGRLHDPALAPDGFTDPEVAERLRQRFERAAG